MIRPNCVKISVVSNIKFSFFPFYLVRAHLVMLHPSVVPLTSDLTRHIFPTSNHTSELRFVLFPSAVLRNPLQPSRLFRRRKTIHGRTLAVARRFTLPPLPPFPPSPLPSSPFCSLAPLLAVPSFPCFWSLLSCPFLPVLRSDGRSDRGDHGGNDCGGDCIANASADAAASTDTTPALPTAVPTA